MNEPANMTANMPFYCEELRAFLPRASCPDSVIMNVNYYIWFRDHITNRLQGNANTKFDYEEDRELLRSCRANISRNNRPLESPELLVLVHPLDLHLTEYGKLNRLMKRDALAYLKNLDRVMRGAIMSGCDIVVLDTPYHYGAATSLLLENNVAQHAILTVMDSGYPRNMDELDIMKGKHVYMAGMYNGRCLSQSMDAIMEGNKPRSLQVIPEAVLDSPRDRWVSLTPKHICFDKKPLPTRSIITLDDFLKRAPKTNRGSSIETPAMPVQVVQ